MVPPQITSTAAKTFQFGAITIPLSQTFLVSKLSYALVNLKPIRPGHVLIAPRRRTMRFNDLTSEEVTDLFAQGQRVSKVVERMFNAESLTLCIQDGPQAGQSVPHVHLHVIPRHQGDFPDNDDIYDVLEGDRTKKKQPHIDNDERKPRSAQEMAEEAEMLRKELTGWNEGAE
ncbi:Dinucleoside triphosphate hydrolase [Coemansia interrupta]|uniref:Bis(5'-adenosyl)-triphosphatase n=1 Tax=Coemansia interrupta TaxID=1126814 RepID=A0A9W8HJ88_9FUNG|nr:Dinucleoside triphosphate hydrolase [Coemansia interrupta]